MVDVAVVGKGIVGSAAARHLSAAGLGVVLVGPDEPADRRAYRGPLAGHHDAGRLVRHTERGLLWATLADRAMRQFPGLEKETGIAFYRPVGSLALLRPGAVAERRAAIRAEIAAALGARFEIVERPADFARLYPGLAVPPGFFGVFQGAPAGHFDPRGLVAAECALAARQGAVIRPGIVRAIARRPGGVRLVLEDGERIEAGQALVAVGAYAGAAELLPRKPRLFVKSELTVQGEVAPGDAAALAALPALTYDIVSPTLESIYLVPPARYPDGRWRIKLGSNTASDRELPDRAAIDDWMRGAGDGAAAARDAARAQEAALRALFPAVSFLRVEAKPCLIARTPTGLPYVDRVDDRIVVALGCNGTSAMSGDTIALLAAELIGDRPWPAPFARETFRFIAAE